MGERFPRGILVAEVRMSEIELFTSKGGLRPSDSFKPAELAKLSAARREIFERVRVAAVALEECEAGLLLAQAALEMAVKARAAAVEALRKVKPPVSAYENWKAVFRPDLLRTAK